MAQKINIKFPFEEGTEGGVFNCNEISTYAYRDDLVALLTLRRGQRPMQNDMYSPVYDYLFEQMDSIIEKQLQKDIQDKVNKYIPQIKITQFLLTEFLKENYIQIKIGFNLKDFQGNGQVLTLNFPTNE